MRTVFIADAHLNHPDDANYRQLLAFINTLRGQVDTLCVLGDLFDFRVGLPNLAFPEHEPLLEALATVQRGGARLIYLEGNHDFRLGDDFAQRIGAEIYPDSFLLEQQGHRIFLCHGDLINQADWSYRLLRRALRSPLTELIARILPAVAIRRIRQRLQRTSKKRYPQHRIRWDYPALIRQFADRIAPTGCDTLLLGHFHQPLFEQHGAMTIVALGDWIDQYQYAELLDGQFRVVRYQP